MLYQCLHLHKTRSMFINEILGPEITVDQAVQMAANRKQWSLNSKLRCENLRNRMGTNSGRNCEVGDHTRRRDAWNTLYQEKDSCWIKYRGERGSVR